MAAYEASSDQDLGAIKKNLKAGRLDKADLKILVSLVERTEMAAKQLRAAIVE